MITAEEVRDLLTYDPETGEFRYRKDVWSKVRNRCYVRAGTIAGYNGRYRSLKISGKFYQLHNLAWLYVYGRWPKDEVDHINRDSTDNRLINLREATRAQNQANRPKQIRNTSGFKGVVRSGNAWGAQFRGTWLGTFSTPEAASAAYESAARRAYGDFVAL